MNVKLNNFRAKDGMTVVELLIVVVIIALVASLALMRQGDSNDRFKRQNAATELKIAFERARFDSVKRRAIAPSDPDDPGIRAYVLIEASSFTLRVDRDQNGTLDAADDQVYPYPSRVAAGGDGFTIPVEGLKVAFNQRGEADVLASDNQPQFLVCGGGACPSENNAETITVLVTATGTVNLLHGEDDPPNFVTPTVTDPAVDIRQEVVLP